MMKYKFWAIVLLQILSGICAWFIYPYLVILLSGVSLIILITMYQEWRGVSQDYQFQSLYHKTLIKQLEQTFQIFDYALFGFYALNEKGRIIKINEYFADMLGAKEKELTAHKHYIHEYIIDQGLQWVKPYSVFSPLAKVTVDDDYFDMSGSVVIRTKSSKKKEIIIRQYVFEKPIPLRDHKIKAIGFSFDLALEMDTILEIQRAQKRLAFFFDKSPVGMAILDHDGFIVEANSAFLELLQVKIEDVLNTRFVEWVVREKYHELSQYLKKVIQHEKRASPREFQLIGEEEKIVTLFAHFMEDKNQETGGVIIQLLDVTQKKHLETRVIQSQKMQAVGQLAGGIAHDFNNLLTAMIGFCDLLLLRHKPGEQSFADAMQIKQNANRAANLVRQLLAFSRQQTLKTTIIDVTDALAELSHLLNRLIGVNVTLDIIHGSDIGKIKADQVQLEQVIINLAVNARDAMKEGGTLTIKTRNVDSQSLKGSRYKVMTPKSYVEITVEDTGTGIPKKNLNRIFEPFFTTKALGSGTGLGLATVYGIVNQTGGYIFVDSQINKGTCFTLYFPITEEETIRADEMSKQKMIMDLTGQETILFVEDEEPVRVFAVRALRAKGYEVIEAEDAQRALEFLEKPGTHIDLMVTDLIMPGMDGAELINIVKQQRPALKILCVSGYAEDTVRNKLQFSQDVHFLAKPFSLKDLAQNVKELLQ